MRVLQILPELVEGGVERGTVELGRELVRRGHESWVISRGGPMTLDIEKDGGRHYTMDVASKNPLTVPMRVAELRKAFRQIGPDIVHVRSRVPAWLTSFAKKGMGIPVISTVHGFNSVNFYSRIMTRFDHTICVSEAVRRYIMEHYGINETGTSVIPRGVDMSVFDPAGLDGGFMEEFRRKYMLQGRYVIANVGRITQLKGIEVFIKAIAELRKKNPEVLGLVVGGVRSDKEGYSRMLMKEVESSGLKEHILFVGSQKKIAEIYEMSDIVVNTSLKPESFGRSAAEALAMERPVIASAHGGVLDIVIEGYTGWLFPPGDYGTLSEKIAEARQIKLRGMREFVRENFSLEQMVEKTLAVYERYL